jgi:hypothetical protein
MPAKRKGGDNTSETSAQETNETTAMVTDSAATGKISKRAKKEPEPVVEPAPQKVIFLIDFKIDIRTII